MTRFCEFCKKVFVVPGGTNYEFCSLECERKWHGREQPLMETFYIVAAKRGDGALPGLGEAISNDKAEQFAVDMQATDMFHDLIDAQKMAAHWNATYQEDGYRVYRCSGRVEKEEQ